MAMGDTEIVELFWNRDERAIEATAEKYENYCSSIAVNILENWEDAEECVSDTYLKAWNCIPPNRPFALRIFLGKITRNLAFDRYKKRNAARRGDGITAMVLEELAECVPGGEEPDAAFDRKELIQTINSFLGTISSEKCALFVRRYWYAESITEIAHRYGMSENKVSVSLNRIRRKLYAYLLERGFVE